jgi:hypothetical protein
MSRLLSATAILAALGATAVGITACATDDTERTGTIDLALVGQASSGAFYRLRDAELTIAPAGLVFRTEDDPDRQVISARLPSGLYTLGLAPGWRLERISGGTVQTVFAVLTSEDPQPFDVIPGERTPVVLQFRADGTNVQFGDGDVDISIGVDDIPQGQTDGGVPDARGWDPDAPTIDAGGPDGQPGYVYITSAPTGVVTTNQVTIEFESSRPGDTWCYAYALGFGEPCTSPYTTPPLPEGSQGLAVYLSDGSAWAETYFTVDTTP